MKAFQAGIAVLAALIAGCSSGQNFSEVTGNLRVSGHVDQDVFSPQNRNLSLHLTDAGTGYPLDANDVEVQAGAGKAVRAVRKQLGSYTANFSDADRVEVLILTNDRTAVIALQKR